MADKEPAVAEAPASESAAVRKLIFGNFKKSENAKNLAARLSRLLKADIRVESLHDEQGVLYRVTSATYSGKVLSILRRIADRHELSYWLLTPPSVHSDH